MAEACRWDDDQPNRLATALATLQGRQDNIAFDLARNAHPTLARAYGLAALSTKGVDDEMSLLEQPAAQIAPG